MYIQEANVISETPTEDLQATKEKNIEATKKYAQATISLLEVGLFPGHTSDAVSEVKRWLKAIVDSPIEGV